LQTIKKFPVDSIDSMGESPMGLPKATARVDSRLKLT